MLYKLSEDGLATMQTRNSKENNTWRWINLFYLETNSDTSKEKTKQKKNFIQNGVPLCFVGFSLFFIFIPMTLSYLYKTSKLKKQNEFFCNYLI